MNSEVVVCPRLILPRKHVFGSQRCEFPPKQSCPTIQNPPPSNRKSRFLRPKIPSLLQNPPPRRQLPLRSPTPPPFILRLFRSPPDAKRSPPNTSRKGSSTSLNRGTTAAVIADCRHTGRLPQRSPSRQSSSTTSPNRRIAPVGCRRDRGRGCSITYTNRGTAGDDRATLRFDPGHFRGVSMQGYVRTTNKGRNGHAIVDSTNMFCI
ncbi:hypothetical protein EJB05_38733, partial [Eragrostis curvula]